MIPRGLRPRINVSLTDDYPWAKAIAEAVTIMSIENVDSTPVKPALPPFNDRIKITPTTVMHVAIPVE